MTIGLRPSGTNGSCTWIERKPFLRVASYVRDGSGGSASATRAGGLRHAARQAIAPSPSTRMAIMRGPRVGKTRMMASGRGGWCMVVASLALAACAPRPLVERAIRARGGPLESVIRDVEADVRVGFPGTWRWQTAFMVPDRYAWTI